ncbi:MULTISPECIES: SDR family oxidoreductase [Delftia]|uniref:SDR family oxidoreductase n=1 Tax=Delftia TaxID=80865 RepID=UPI001BAEDE30|nr:MULTISPECIES: SDR family oxidoreductase [Delftia]MBS3722813.1 3-oxoacyl-[acyl-carrier-protein] reductase FabG [Delftia sp. PE138]MDC2857357.1 SDR family oxidoreductase [Delftia sp. DT-2]
MSAPENFPIRTALVTGAARGIGLATAIELLRDGRRVVLADLAAPDLDRVPQELRARASAVVLDVCDEAARQRVVGDIVQRHGGVDILVNNAGISLKNASGQSNGILEVGLGEVQQILDVNLLSMLRLCQLALPGMKQRGWGRIVNVSSLAGRGKSIVAGPAYMLSKSAVLGLSRSIASEMGQYGITTNCVAPGRILTPMAQQAGDEVNRRYAEQIPVRRLGEAAEVGAAIRYLCSESAGFTNGAVIDVNGGFFMN